MKFPEIALVAEEMHKKMQTSNKYIAPIAVLGNSHSIESSIKSYYPNKHIVIDLYHTTPLDDKTWGLYTKFENETRILFDIDISSSLNNCWTRFVGAKELSHTILDKSNHSSTDVISLVEMLLTQPLTIKKSEELHSEYFTLLFAIEILIPYRVNTLVLDKKNTSYEIAEMLKVPEQMIDLVRSKDYQLVREESYN